MRNAILGNDLKFEKAHKKDCMKSTITIMHLWYPRQKHSGRGYSTQSCHWQKKTLAYFSVALKRERLCSYFSNGALRQRDHRHRGKKQNAVPSICRLRDQVRLHVWVEFVVEVCWFSSFPRRFFSLVFNHAAKINISKFQFDQDSWTTRMKIT